MGCNHILGGKIAVSCPFIFILASWGTIQRKAFIYSCLFLQQAPISSFSWRAISAFIQWAFSWNQAVLYFSYILCLLNRKQSPNHLQWVINSYSEDDLSTPHCWSKIPQNLQLLWSLSFLLSVEFSGKLLLYLLFLSLKLILILYL